MWFQYLSSLTIVATTFCVIVSAFILIHTLSKAKGGKNRNYPSPPEAKGAWPIIGHLHLLGGPDQLLHKVLGDMASQYGHIFTIKLGSHKTLVVSSAALAKECFTTNDKAFSSRPKAQAFDLMAYNHAVFGFSPYMDYWRQVRKITVREVLCQPRVKTLESLRVSQLKASIKVLYDAWRQINKSAESTMVKVKMSHWFGELSLNTFVRIITGRRFSAHDNEEGGARFRRVIRDYFELLGAFVVPDYIPFLKFLDIGGYTKLMKKNGKDMDQVIEGWLQEQKLPQDDADADADANEESNNHHHDGVIKVLTSIFQNAELPGFDHETVMKATCHLLITAGLDTTSATLTWAISLLLNNPRALESAQAEIDEHIGRERLVEESDLKKLVYLEAIIKETLRLYPAAPLAIPHESIEDCVVGGYHIPKGTRLLVNISKIHRDPNTWSNPDEFQPERFLTSSIHKDVSVRGTHFELIPFSSGRRMCPGSFLALQQMRITLASLIQQFVIKKQSPIDMKQRFGITVCKEKPLEVLIAPRLSLHMYN